MGLRYNLFAVGIVALSMSAGQAHAQRLGEPLKDVFNRAARGGGGDDFTPPPAPHLRPTPSPSFRSGPDIGGPRGPGGLSPSDVLPANPTLPPRLNSVPANPPSPPQAPSLTGTFNNAARPK